MAPDRKSLSKLKGRGGGHRTHAKFTLWKDVELSGSMNLEVVSLESQYVCFFLPVKSKIFIYMLLVIINMHSFAIQFYSLAYSHFATLRF
jgi:hypothetical protein